MIPKKVFYIWFNKSEKAPEIKGLDILRDAGYEIHEVNLENMECEDDYPKQAIAVGAWVKASDYLRCWYLNKYGGIYLDTDFEVLKSFDDLLDNKFFTACECDNPKLVANACMGSTPDNGHLKEFMRRASKNRGDNNSIGVLQAGMHIWREIMQNAHSEPDVTIYPYYYFYPYYYSEELDREKHIRPETHAIHHWAGSWI